MVPLDKNAVPFSPNSNKPVAFLQYPNVYPANTTCTYIIDGLKGDQNLEKVILTFETFAVLSDSE